MSNKTKEKIIKINAVISMIFLIALFPGSLIYCWFLSEEVLTIVLNTILALYGVSGITLIILIPIFSLKQKPIKADRMALPYKQFEELNNFLKSSLSKNQYQSYDTIRLNEQDSLQIFTKKKKMWELDCFVVIKSSEVNEEILNLANDAITRFLTEYYGTERITDWINMISLLCVDRITPTFQKFVDSNVEQGMKNSRLLAGISFGRKTLYIAKQNDGFAIAKYKKLRKEFFKIMDTSDKK